MLCNFVVAVSLLLHFQLVVAGGGCSCLIVVLSILINFVVFIVFLFSKMDLDQHEYLNYCLGTIGC